MDPFETEHRVFAARLSSLLQTHPGWYAVVFPDRIVDVCETLESAVETGWQRTGSRRFLVRRIERDTAPVLLPAWVA